MLSNRRGQSFIEFCVISGAIILVVAALGPTIAGKVQGVMTTFLNSF
jgi:Flp pilus assembly pilin Flp